MTGDIPPDEPAPGSRDRAGRERNGRESHSYHRAKRLLRDVNVRSRVLFSGKTRVGKQNLEERAALVQMAGGEDAVTPVIRHAIEELTLLRMYRTCIDTFMVERPSNVVNRRSRKAAPILETRLRISDAMGRLLERLETSIAAAKAVGGDSLQAQFAKAVRSANDRMMREELEEELARRKALEATPTGQLEWEVQKITHELGDAEHHQYERERALAAAERARQRAEQTPDSSTGGT